jgi:hypothetical protein
MCSLVLHCVLFNCMSVGQLVLLFFSDYSVMMFVSSNILMKYVCLFFLQTEIILFYLLFCAWF